MAGGHTMKAYTALDGRTFTAEERYESLRVMRIRIKAGLMPDFPDHCSWCYQTEGLLNWHAEDYSHPWRYLIPVCFRCHMIVHSRFWCPPAWENYLQAILQGWRWPGVPRKHAYTHGFATLARENGLKRGPGAGLQDHAGAMHFRECTRLRLLPFEQPFINDVE